MTAQGSNQERDRIDALFDKLFVASLNDDECREIWSAAVADKDLMRRYFEIVHLREGLPYLLSQPGPTGVEADQASAAGLLRTSASKESVSGSQLAEFPKHFNRIRESYLELGRWRQVLAVAVGLAFVFGATATWLLTRWSDRLTHLAEVDSPRQMHSVSSVPLLPFAQGHRLGSITGLSLEASAEGMVTSMQVGQELRRGEVVQLSLGFVRVRLESGPEIIVEGPAEFSLVGDKSIFVRVGRVTATAAEGLRLQSPLVRADCQDAKLVFVAEEESATRIYALEGEVNVSSTAHVGMASEKLRTLRAPSGLIANAVENSGLSIVQSAPPSAAVRSWQDVEARLSNYQQVVLSDRPLAYWPLGRVLRNRRVLDLAQNGFDGLAIGNWPDESDGTPDDGDGTYFNGESYIEPDRKPPINLRKGFTVEAWAKVVGPPAYQSLFTSRWVFESNNPKQQCFGFTLYAGEDDCWQFWTGNGRFGETWSHLESAIRVDRQRWTHVVATFVPTGNEGDGTVEGKVFLYVNGKQIAAGVHDMSLTDFEWPARIGAAEFVPHYLTSWLFKGFMRDVAVYDYPLEIHRIEAHRRMGQTLEDSRLSQRQRLGSMSAMAAMEIWSDERSKD